MKRTTAAKKTAPPLKIRLGSGFVLIMAVAYFFDGQGIIAAALPAVLIHELGHVFAMRLFSVYPIALNATLSGFSLDYSGAVSGRHKAFTALAGPAFGLLFALICARLAAALECEYLFMCAGLGFVLNCFNLLPALPLDGGHAARWMIGRLWGNSLSRIAMLCLGFGVSAALCVFGLYLIAGGHGAALLLAGIWLMLLQRNDL